MLWLNVDITRLGSALLALNVTTIWSVLVTQAIVLCTYIQ